MRFSYFALLLVACTADSTVDTVAPLLEPSEPCPSVRLSPPHATGDVLTTNLRALTVDNGIVRIRYGAHTHDFRDLGVTEENLDRHMDHVLAARHTDDPTVNEAEGCVSAACHSGGSHWHDAVYPRYGDGAKYVMEPNHDADRLRVLVASDDAVELSYEWDVLRLDGLRAPGSCQLGKFPECGPTSKDTEGNVVYKRDGETLKSIKVVKVWKIVRVERCLPGYFASIRSNPPLVWPEQGSRTMRLGYVTTAVAWSCDGLEISKHPNAGFHASLGTSDCIADIPIQLPGHESWPFVRFMKTQKSVPFNSLQYSANQLGSPGTEALWDSVGVDGRQTPWQVFIGAAEYVPADIALEPTPTARALVQGALIEIAKARW